MMRRAFALTALCGAAGYAALRAQARNQSSLPFATLKVPREMRASDIAAGPIDVIPVGPIASGRLIFLCEVIEEVYGAPCRTHPSREAPHEAWNGARGQLDADAMLGFLVDSFPNDASRVLGVTSLDMAAGGRPYVFGYGHLRDRVAVVSIARLEEAYYGRPADERLLRLRLYKAAVHELGHTAGDPHCGQAVCIMREVADLEVLDGLPLFYCERCLLRVRHEMRLPPQSPQAQFSLGTALLRRRRFGDAVAALGRAADAEPGNAVYLNDLGVALLRAGDRRGAMRAFQRAKRLRPDLREPDHNMRLVEHGMVAPWEPESANLAAATGARPGPSSPR